MVPRNLTDTSEVTVLTSTKLQCGPHDGSPALSESSCPYSSTSLKDVWSLFFLKHYVIVHRDFHVSNKKPVPTPGCITVEKMKN